MQVAIYKKGYDKLPNVGIVKLDKDNSRCEMHGRMLLNKKIFSIKDKLPIHNNKEIYLSYALLKFKRSIKI